MGYFIPVEAGVKLYVEDVNPLGHKTIVFLHGWPLNHKQFEYQFDVLPAKGFRCIGIDWRGFGCSDKPFHGYTFDRLAQDIRTVVDTLRLQPFTLVGHSTGAAIAIKYAVRYGVGRLSRLVLVGAAAPRGLTRDNADRLLAETMNDRPNMMRGVTDQFFFQYISKPFMDWFCQLGMEAAGWSTAAVVTMLRDEHLEADVQQVTVPTLIIHGTHDKLIPYSQAEELHRKIRNSRLVPFQYSGHGSFYEERDKFNQLLAQFSG